MAEYRDVQSFLLIGVGSTGYVVTLFNQYPPRAILTTLLLPLAGLALRHQGYLNSLVDVGFSPRDRLIKWASQSASGILESRTMLNRDLSRKFISDVSLLLFFPITVALTFVVSNLGRGISVVDIKTVIQGMGSIFLATTAITSSFRQINSRLSDESYSQSDAELVQDSAMEVAGFLLISLGFLVSFGTIGSNPEVFIPDNRFLRGGIVGILLTGLLLLEGISAILKLIVGSVYIIVGIVLTAHIWLIAGQAISILILVLFLISFAFLLL